MTTEWIESIEVSGLRGVRTGRVEGLAPLTIIVGANGSGKSTLLEAIGIACAGTSAQLAIQALGKREWLGLDALPYWIDEKSGATASVTIARSAHEARRSEKYHLTLGPHDDEMERDARGRGVKGELFALNLRRFVGTAFASDSRILLDTDGRIIERKGGQPARPFEFNAPFVERPAGARARFGADRFSSQLREALKVIKLSPWYDEWLGLLRMIRPALISIESLAVGDRDEPFVFETVGGARAGYPLAFAGDGFRRSLLLAATLAAAKTGVAALDEPEAYAHPSLCESLAKMIRRAVLDETQVFIATHSLEFTRDVVEAFEKEPSLVAIVGLRCVDGELDPIVVSGDDAYRRVVELRDDLRL